LLETSIKLLSDTVFLINEEIRFEYVNDVTCHKLGYTREELLGMQPTDIDPEIDLEAASAMMQRTLIGESISFETHHRTKHGRLFPVEINAVLVEFNGRRFSLSVARDISERRQMLDKLRRSEQAFRRLVENLPDLVLRYDENCRRTFVSPSYEQFTGMDSRPALGKSPLEYWPLSSGRQGAARYQAHLQQVLDSKRPTEWELPSPRSSGEVLTLEFRAAPEFNADGRVTGVITVARDISARRAMEQQLRTAASVFDAAKEGIFITDPNGLIYDTNPAFSAITGYAQGDVLDQCLSLLVPQEHDRKRYYTAWTTLKKEGAWSGEIVSQRKSGETYHVYLNIMAMHDEHGSPNYYIGIFSDITQLKLHEQQLQHLAYHDALTGLPNRLLLSDRLSQAIAQASRSNKKVAVLYLDLDGFKPINDNFGHEKGDLVLVEIARRLSDSLRESDTVARIGGDEFVALLTDISALSECEVTSRRLLDSITQPIMLDGHRLNLSASIGISRYPDDGSADADILLRYADQAMYLAKAAGRNQFLFYGDSSRAQVLHNTKIIHQLRLALDQNQISVHYQPIIDLGTGQVIKAEALARWNHHELGMIPSSEFIPVAETSGLMHWIGELVFEQAVRVAKTWNDRTKSPPDEPKRISVNISPRQFFHRNGVSNWVRHLQDQGVGGQLITVEITEGLLLEDRSEVLEQLNLLRDMGITISLDDFGTGYSALSYLKKFDIDYLKIDRSFICNIVDDPKDRAIVEAIIIMAKRLGFKLVAEGVETRSQAAMLGAVDCDMAQGYWYAKPMPESEFLAFVRRFRGQTA
jgi:diguanylate cyclase (GGDEF)-like protein/PAS domain S-box-containing protein